MRTQKPEAETREPERGRPPGKRTDPDYLQVSAYIQRRTHDAVREKLAEQPSKDFSVLVDELLVKWLGRQRKLSTVARNLLNEIARERQRAETASHREWSVPSAIKSIKLNALVSARAQIEKASDHLPECVDLHAEFRRLWKQLKLPSGKRVDIELVIEKHLDQAFDWLQEELKKLADSE